MKLYNLLAWLLFFSTILMADDVILPESAHKTVLVPQTDIAQTWRTNLDFDDSEWLLCSGAPGGVGYEMDSGYENFISLDVVEYMRDEDKNPNTSCYVRIKFQVTSEQIQNLDKLNLFMRYDDGFVAYLNGVRVAEANAPESLTWNSTAAGSHEANGNDLFNITEYKSELKSGENLLAIHGLNTNLTSSDFLINASLVSSEDPFKNFTSSNLPIIMIDTNNETIPDEPKISAHMGIIHNGDGQRNNLTDPFNEYDGFIGIEMRGYSSQSWPKKPYGFETRTATGDNNNVSLLGMPPENDWVLHAPYVDKTLMRNVLIYHLAREMGWWAPRTQYCELFLNGEYMGVYVLVEKLKQDKNRLDIEEPDSENLSGGYILEMTLDGRVRADETSFNAQESKKPLVVKYPKPEHITAEQTSWITDFYNDFENVLYSPGFADPENGYPKYIDIPSFVDHMLLAEGFNQLDAFSHSQHFYKRQDGKLFMGPAWDYNRTMGNASYYTVWATNEWWLLEPRGGTRAAYANRLMADPVFMQAYQDRWTELRQSLFSLDYIYSLIDEWVIFLEEARIRNFVRWPVLGVSVSHKVVFDTYEEEVDYMRNWIFEKFTWLDGQFVDAWAGALVSDQDFKKYDMPPHTGRFVAEWDMRANASDMDGVTGLANAATGCDAYSDLACVVRFNPDGLLDVRNGGAYAFDERIEYNAGDEFHVRLVGDISNRTYDVYITPKNGTTIQLASNYDFRTDQAQVEKLDCYVLIAPEASHNLKNFTIFEPSDWADSQQSQDSFENYDMATQRDVFTAEFDMRANASNMNGVLGLSDIATGCDAYADLACIVRFNPDGLVDARNGADYANDATIEYGANDAFHIRMEINIPTKKYDVYVTPEGGSEILLASGYDFRTDQANVEKLDRYVSMSQDNSFNFKNFMIRTETSIENPHTQAPEHFALRQNYPNPFNPSTSIVFSLPKAAAVELSIFNQRGQLVRQLCAGVMQAGEHFYEWDGTNSSGTAVTSGLFFYRLKADEFTDIKKMMLVR